MSSPEILGIDVSRFNGKVDFGRVRDAGIDFVYICTLIGLGTKDPLFDENAKGCKDAGLPFGCYQLLYPRLGALQDAQAQAAQLLELSEQSGASLDPVADLEDGPPGPPNDGQWASAWAAWRDCIWRRTERRPGAYFSPAFALARPQLLHELQRAPCPWWAASYTDAAPTALGNVTPTAWQYQGGGSNLPERFCGHVDGVNGYVDRSRLLTGTLYDLSF